MKNTFLICVLFLGFNAFSQKCIESYIGIYHVDIEATMPFFEKTAYAQQGVLEKGFEQIIHKARVILDNESLTLDMSETTTTIPYTARKSVKENGTCDLLLDMSEMGVPEEAKDMYLTLYRKGEGQLQIINSVEPKEMDNYIWIRLE
jgi:hypothetical protein